MGYYIASVSWGKDSTYMLLELIKRNYPLNEVVFYDTEMEFQAVYDVRDKILPLLADCGIEYTELKPDTPFLYNMFDRKVQSRDGTIHYGYSWCGGRCRWGTTDKLQAIDKYAKNETVYVGIAADEPERIAKLKPYKIAPLADWGVTESDALHGCYNAGFDWQECGYRLYDLLDRVSCWCCANKNLKELRNIYMYMPQYWDKLKELQSRTERPMKGQGKSVFDLERRFELERQYILAGKSITNKYFYKNLKEMLEEKSR